MRTVRCSGHLEGVYGGVSSECVCPREGCLPKGWCESRAGVKGVSAHGGVHLPHGQNFWHASENITFPQLLLGTVTMSWTVIKNEIDSFKYNDAVYNSLNWDKTVICDLKSCYNRIFMR